MKLAARHFSSAMNYIYLFTIVHNPLSTLSDMSDCTYIIGDKARNLTIYYHFTYSESFVTLFTLQYLFPLYLA